MDIDANYHGWGVQESNNKPIVQPSSKPMRCQSQITAPATTNKIIKRRRQRKDEKGQGMQNMSGYNIVNTEAHRGEGLFTT